MNIDTKNATALPTAFTIRVYGILMDSDRRILVSDEFIRGNFFTKFPGGGMELGEGTRDCLKREFKEETMLDIEVGEHIYTTDFYQQSAFNGKHQMIGVYYFVNAIEPVNLATKTKPFDFAPEQIADPNGQSEVTRWIEWDDFDENSVNLPIDKIVVSKIKENFRHFNKSYCSL